MYHLFPCRYRCQQFLVVDGDTGFQRPVLGELLAEYCHVGDDVRAVGDVKLNLNGISLNGFELLTFATR